MVTMTEAFSSFWSNYANFRGRSSRSEYWFWQLWLFIIFFGSGLLAFIPVVNIIVGIASLVFWLAVVIPNISLSVRRLHDTGRRWYWLLVPFLPTLIAAVFAAILLIQMGSASSSFYSNSSQMYEMLLASFGAYAVIIAIIQVVCFIAWIVLMCLPTSPDAIGESTYPDGGHYRYRAGGSGAALAGQGYGSAAALPTTGLAAIKGVDGMYRDVNFPLNLDEEVVIGRDAALAHIVLDKNAEKVSRKHCSVAYDSRQNSYRVFDYSTNGTFKDDGTRLMPNTAVYLPAGTLLCLGNRTNSIRLM